ncbi:MAG TPA: hypothetical protein ENI90_07220 [Methylothermaceae bacterium]|nr:hypothetical protein [Methylothermaceae bacterium]
MRDWYARPAGYFIAVGDGELEIYRQEDDALKLIDRLAEEDLANWKQSIQLDESQPVTLLLKPGQYLQRRIILPVAAQENLHQVVGFELDRLTPFSTDQVYYTARLLKPLPGERISVECILILKALLDPYLDLLAAAGLPPHQVSILPPDGSPRLEIDLLPPERRPRTHRWQHWLNYGLTVLLIGLITVAMTMPILHQQQTIAKLERAVRQTRKAAREANQLQRKVATLKQQAHFVLDKKQAARPLIAVLEELSQRLPEDTWLTGFHYRQGKLQIDGKSPAASKLVELLEKSPYFRNVHFVSPVTQDRVTGMERFRISMEVSSDDTE